MAEETWNAVARPILNWVAYLGPERTTFDSPELVEALGLDAVVVSQEFGRLEREGYFEGEVIRPWDPTSPFFRYVGPGLSAKGLREVGSWPSSDPYEALLSLIDSRIEGAVDEDEASRWRRVRTKVRDLGTEVGAKVFAALMVEAAKGQIG
jgi:hypothetical protein